MQSKTLGLVPSAPSVLLFWPRYRVSYASRECETKLTDLDPLEKLSKSSLDFMKSNLCKRNIILKWYFF